MAKVAKRRGRYVLDFYDQKGERQRISLPDGTTKAQAVEQLRMITEQVLKGSWLPDKRIPLFKDVARDWIEYKRPKLRETTWEIYEGHVRNHFSFFDNLKINQITTAKAEHFITAK